MRYLLFFNKYFEKKDLMRVEAETAGADAKASQTDILRLSNGSTRRLKNKNDSCKLSIKVDK